MAIDSGQAKTTEPGLAALVMLLRFHGVGADGDQIRHQFGTAAIGVPEMLRCAKDFGLRRAPGSPPGIGWRARRCR